MTAIDYAALVERAKESAQEISSAGHNGWGNVMTDLADAIERLTQPCGEVKPIRLVDSQWMNIVNHDRAYENYDTEDAVHLAVKLTEARMAKNAAETFARLIAERDAAIADTEASDIAAEFRDRCDALQEQVKTLRAALACAVEWGEPMKCAPVDARPLWFDRACKALAATEPKEKTE